MSDTAIPPEPGTTDKGYPQTASDKKLNELGYDLLGEQRRAVQLAGLSLGEPVLDVATGSGRMALALMEAGYHVISGDISGEVVSETRQRIGKFVSDAVEFRVLDATQLDLPNASFQSVVTANAMHHMEEPGRALEEVTRVLKPDGKLVIVEFNERGFEVIGQVHRAVHHKRHEQGRISAREIHAFLHSHFEQVEHHVLAINNVWVASGKKIEPSSADHGSQRSSPR